ncbi:MAG: hypothetical protein P9L94_18690 [Candidatus Hinthialibacter antarcticus]|nr:hypothetical protein [Candidatus Hinthialibacter antarcticus]
MPNDNQKELAGQFQKEMTRQKAQELGVSPDTLTTRVKNGKRIWIQKAQLHAELEKQRQVGSKQIIRSIRGGNNSLYSCIIFEAKRVMKLVNEEESLNALDRRDYVVAVEKIHSSAVTWAEEISSYEDQIDQAKKNDPVFGQGERVMHEMLSAQKDGNPERVIELKNAYSDLLKKYERRRKSILPYIESARTCRLSLQKEYWKILQTGWKVREESIQQIFKQFNNAAREAQTQELKMDFKSAREISQSLNDIASGLRNRNPGSASDSAAWDPVLNELKALVDRQMDLWIQIQFLANQIQSIESKTRTGMAFQNQKKDKK